MSAGKGDRRRPGSLRAYEEGFERIWGKKKRCKRHGPGKDPYCVDCFMDNYNDKQKRHENENDHSDG